MLSRNAKRNIAIGTATAVLCAFGAVACDTRLQLTSYNIYSEKLSASVKLVFISDLHDSLFGKGQSQLIQAVEAEKPDIIIFGGDIADKTKMHYPKNAYLLAKELAEKYPCYYAMGNHENSRGDSALIKQTLSDYGVTVLEGSGEVISINGNSLEICGIYDAHTYDEIDGELINQLDAVTADIDGSRYRMLLAHFPEQIDEYLKGGFDLILSGHAHGGQWRIPGLIEGVYAPGQGFFPKYTNGLYCHGDTVHLVSRGLWKPSTVIAVPRVFNRPELVTVNLIPKPSKTAFTESKK